MCWWVTKFVYVSPTIEKKQSYPTDSNKTRKRHQDEKKKFNFLMVLVHWEIQKNVVGGVSLQHMRNIQSILRKRRLTKQHPATSMMDPGNEFTRSLHITGKYFIRFHQQRSIENDCYNFPCGFESTLFICKLLFLPHESYMPVPYAEYYFNSSFKNHFYLTFWGFVICRYTFAKVLFINNVNLKIVH